MNWKEIAVKAGALFFFHKCLEFVDIVASNLNFVKKIS